MSLRSRLQAFGRRISKLREDSVPYVTRFPLAPGRRLPKAQDYPGLLHLQKIDSGEESELVAYWKSRELADSKLQDLAHALNAVGPTHKGYVRQLVERQSWWKRLPVGTGILYLTSLYGALMALNIYYATWTEAPDVGFRIAGRRVLDFLPSDELVFDIVATNRSSKVESVVTLHPPVLLGSEEAPLGRQFDLDLRPLPVTPRTARSILVMGDAFLPVGPYEVRVEGEARTGRFGGKQHLNATKRLNIWDPEPEVRIEKVVSREIAPRIAWMEGWVLVGEQAPYGLKCQINIREMPDVELADIDLRGVNWEETEGLESDLQLTVFTAAGNFDEMTRYPLKICLGSSSESPVWDTVTENVTVACDRAQPKGVAK